MANIMRAIMAAPTTTNYFVDESGDGTLFNRKRQEAVGTPGCTRFFILGVLDVRDEIALERDLADLRKWVLAHPYLKNVPSVQPQARKTAIAFHAHDDCPEVRQSVFEVLCAHDLRFLAIVRDKREVLEYVHSRNATDPTYKYHPNELYEYLVRRLFKNILHKTDIYSITFAKRGPRDRTRSLQDALEAARNRFADSHGIQAAARVRVSAESPSRCKALQAADYFLWALQRFYERHEDRYLTYLWPRFRLVDDMDDTHQNRYGEYYSKERPLTRAALEGRPGI
jgi:hypothetical protein